MLGARSPWTQADENMSGENLEIRELAQSVGDRGCAIVINLPHKLTYCSTPVMESDDEEKEN